MSTHATGSRFGTFRRLLLVVLAAFLAFCAGTAVGSLFVPADSGLAAPAIALSYGLGAMIVAGIATALLARRLDAPRLHAALAVALALTTIVAVWIAVRVLVLHSEAPPIEGPPTPVTTAAFRIASGLDLPMGLGIAAVAPAPGGVLHFYGSPGYGESPDVYPAVDSITFGPGLPSVDIATAPPWLAPEFIKMDYEILHFRVVTLTPAWAEVVGNGTNGHTWWVDRSAVGFTAWPEFLVGVAAVVALDGESNPARARPLDDSPILADAEGPLAPLAVQGDWLMVSISHLADRIRPAGWIRWRDAGRLLVRYEPLS